MLLIGTGTGGMTPQAPFSLSFGSVAGVAAGDFNGDGNQDFAVVNQAANSVSVFLGNGNGTFQASTTYATGLSPTSITVGNFRNMTINGLPELDIVTANSTAGTVSFLANKGNGTFAPAVSSAVAGSIAGSGPTSVHASDLNGDGIPDLLCLLGPGNSNDVTALLGNGAGTFHTGTTISLPGGGSSNAIAAGDLVGAVTPQTDLVLTNSSQISTLLEVSAGATNQLSFAQQPANAPTTGLLSPITVDVEDSNSNLLTSDNSNVSLSIASGPAGAVLSGTATVAAINGVATFTNVSISTAGSYTLTASDSTASSATSIVSRLVPPRSSRRLCIQRCPQASSRGPGREELSSSISSTPQSPFRRDRQL